MRVISTRAGSGQPPLLVSHTLRPKIAFRNLEGMVIVRWGEILRCEASSNYTRIFLRKGKTFLVSRTIGDIAAALPTRQFIRTHQSHLVSIDAIVFVGRDEVEIENGKKIPVARNRRKMLVQRMEQVCLQL